MGATEKEYIQDLERLESVLKSSSNKYQTTIQIAQKAKAMLYSNSESESTDLTVKPILVAIDSFLDSD